jgi:hypothetical protein
VESGPEKDLFAEEAIKPGPLVHDDIARTSKQHIYEDGVGLCNPVIPKGLKIKAQADAIPKRLLICARISSLWRRD